MTEQAKKVWKELRWYQGSAGFTAKAAEEIIDTAYAPVFKERDKLKADLEVLSETLCQYGEALGAVNQTVDALLAESITWARSSIARAAIQSSLSRLKRIAAAEKLREESCSD